MLYLWKNDLLNPLPPQWHFLLGLRSFPLGVHVQRPAGSGWNGQHCHQGPGGNQHPCDWPHQTAVRWQHPLDQGGWKTQHGLILSHLRPHMNGRDKRHRRSCTPQHSPPSRRRSTAGRGWIPLSSWFRLSDHKPGSSIQTRTGESPSLWLSTELWQMEEFRWERQQHLFGIEFSLGTLQHDVLRLLPRLLWLLAETIMMSAALTAPSERPLMCMMDPLSVQVCYQIWD